MFYAACTTLIYFPTIFSIEFSDNIVTLTTIVCTWEIELSKQIFSKVIMAVVVVFVDTKHYSVMTISCVRKVVVII